MKKNHYLRVVFNPMPICNWVFVQWCWGNEQVINKRGTSPNRTQERFVCS